MLKPKYHTLKDFKLESGDILPEVKLEYATQGKKETDEDGNINNAVLYLHGWTGDYNSVENLSDIIGPGKALNTNRFFLISPTALGSPGSTCPSTSQLRSEFPDYGIKDMATANYQLITQNFGIKHLRGIMGTSMGGFQALQWILEYPDFVDFLLLNGTSQRVSNQMYGVYRLLSRIIEDDPDYDGGNYSENPVRAMEKVSNLTFLWTFSPAYFQNNFSSREEFIGLLDEMGEEAAQWDANDIIWRTRALLNYDLEGMLSTIDLPTLVTGNIQDQVIDLETSLLPLYKAIKKCKLFLFDSPLGHYGCIKDIYKAENAIKEFIRDIIG
ncbi:MAG: alpha/beta fold hydrolase [Methanobacteriaceae archaeon]